MKKDVRYGVGEDWKKEEKACDEVFGVRFWWF